MRIVNNPDYRLLHSKNGDMKVVNLKYYTINQDDYETETELEAYIETDAYVNFQEKVRQMRGEIQ